MTNIKLPMGCVFCGVEGSYDWHSDDSGRDDGGPKTRYCFHKCLFSANKRAINYKHLIGVGWCTKCDLKYNVSIWDIILPEIDKIFRHGKLNIKCDCGGEKANTTHSDWCSTR